MCIMPEPGRPARKKVIFTGKAGGRDEFARYPPFSVAAFLQSLFGDKLWLGRGDDARCFIDNVSLTVRFDRC